MLPRFYLEEINKLNKQANYLLAVSGGVDSMVLLHSMVHLGYRVSVAHVNYGLRGEASNSDEELVCECCAKYKIHLYVKKANTLEFSREHKLSVQEAARKIRYDWFRELVRTYGYEKLLTAHHLNDSIETFFINFLRGTGIRGLKGISEENDFVLRPFLALSSAEIRAYAQDNAIPFREDASNAEDKYLRNSIRHHVVPAFEKVGNLYGQAAFNFKLIAEQVAFYDEASQNFLKQFVKTEQGGMRVDLPSIKNHRFGTLILTEYLLSKGFSKEQVKDMMYAKTGAIFLSHSYKATINAAQNLALYYTNNSENQPVFTILVGETLYEPIGIKAEMVSVLPDEFSQNEAYLDLALLQEPLQVRRVTSGDWFVPFGMQGKKKLSDFFTNIKVDRIRRENLWVVTSQENIIWVVGYRSDNRYRVTEKTSKILKLSVC
ncbi:MAG: tRNA lysidine(34) synthetase TilS [Flavobacteriales bacterium]